MPGLLWTLLLIVSCVLLGSISSKAFEKKLGDDSNYVGRKIVHIGVANWYFIYVSLSMDEVVALVGLALAAVLNATYLARIMNHRSLGLALYPVSIMAMIALSMMGFGSDFSLGCGLLVMGYGDGLAGLFGKLLGKRKLPGKKVERTYAGSFTMFLTSFVILIILCLSVYKASVSVFLSCVAVSALATAAEAFTPGGLDNLSVPLVVFCTMEVLSCRFF